MRWLIIIAAVFAGLSENDIVFSQPVVHIDLTPGHTVHGVSENDVIFENKTGLPIVRIQIGERTLEDGNGISSGKILVSVSPHKHHVKVFFRGGADVSFPHFDFRNVHEVTFVREQNKIEAHIQ